MKFDHYMPKVLQHIIYDYVFDVGHQYTLESLPKTKTEYDNYNILYDYIAFYLYYIGNKNNILKW